MSVPGVSYRKEYAVTSWRIAPVAGPPTEATGMSMTSVFVAASMRHVVAGAPKYTAAFPLPELEKMAVGWPALHASPVVVASAFAYHSALFHHHWTIHASAPCVVRPSPAVSPTPMRACRPETSVTSDAARRSRRGMFGPIVPCFGQFASPAASVAELGVVTACRPLPLAI